MAQKSSKGGGGPEKRKAPKRAKAKGKGKAKAKAKSPKQTRAKAKPRSEQPTREMPRASGGRDLTKPLIAVCLVALLAFAGLVAVLSSGGSSDAPVQAQASESQPAPEATASSESADNASQFTERKQYWRHIDRDQFRGLATPAVQHHGDGRFIKSGLHGTPAEKLNNLLTSTAQDRVSLVGLMQAQSNGEYSVEYLRAALKGEQAGPAHYRVWNDYRALLTAPMSNIESIKLNGKFQNTGLSDGGAITATPASYQDVSGSRVATPAMELPSGEFVSGQSAKYKHDCSNRQFETVPPFAIPTPTPGEIPPGEPRKPGEPPSDTPDEPVSPEKAQVPIRDIPGAHEAGHGADLPPKHESEYQGGPPREKKADPPVVTPPGTGGVIKPGDPPPQNDSSGGTVPQPTAPPSPQPDLPPNTGTGSKPPPPPEQGAPPPPPIE